MKKNLLKIGLGVVLLASTTLFGQAFSNVSSSGGVNEDGDLIVNGGDVVTFNFSGTVPPQLNNLPGKILFKFRTDEQDNFSNGFVQGAAVSGQGPIVFDLPAAPAGTPLSYTNLQIRLGAIGEDNTAAGDPYVVADYSGTQERLEGLYFNSDFIYQEYGGATIYDGIITDFVANNPTLSVDSKSLITSKLSPNPTDGELRLDESVDYNSVSIYDIVGKKVMQAGKSSVLNVSALDKGVYVLVTDTNLKGKFVKK
jgi:hypothetical protein